jgi:hypothetical protein
MPINILIACFRIVKVFAINDGGVISIELFSEIIHWFVVVCTIGPLPHTKGNFFH